MEPVPSVSTAMQELLIAAVSEIAMELGFEQRPDTAKFCPSTLIQTLVYGRIADVGFYRLAVLENLAARGRRMAEYEPAPDFVRGACEIDRMILHQWIIVASIWAAPKRSMVKAVAIIQDYVGHLAWAHRCPTMFTTIFAEIAEALRHLARLQWRKKRPSSA